MIEQMPTKHIKLDEQAHRTAKIAAASAGLTLERWLARAIAEQADRERRLEAFGFVDRPDAEPPAP